MTCSQPGRLASHQSSASSWTFWNPAIGRQRSKELHSKLAGRIVEIISHTLPSQRHAFSIRAERSFKRVNLELSQSFFEYWWHRVRNELRQSSAILQSPVRLGGVFISPLTRRSYRSADRLQAPGKRRKPALIRRSPFEDATLLPWATVDSIKKIPHEFHPTRVYCSCAIALSLCCSSARVNHLPRVMTPIGRLRRVTS